MSLQPIGMILLNGLLGYWLVKWVYHTFLLDAAGKRRLTVAKLLHQFKHKRQWDRDRLSAEQLSDLDAMIAEAREIIKNKTALPEVDAWMKAAGPRWERLAHAPGSHWPRETVEILVVVVGVVMGIRGLYLQPFKIPTGSMQPTLYGIHFTEDPDLNQMPGWPKRVFEGVNYSRRYANVIAQGDLLIPFNRRSLESPVVRPKKRLPVLGFFLPQSEIHGDGVTYVVPGEPGVIMKHLVEVHRDKLVSYEGEFALLFKKGDVIIRGHYELGDHLFVDRVSYQFRDPRRGDIVVFVTDGVRARGHGMSGRYYIKRLVGLPGDTLRIKNRRLYVKEAGREDFRLVDGSDHPAFDRIYTMTGGNRGYTHGRLNLRTKQDLVTLGKDEYFMMGDNSENSADSRYWGVVKRDEIVGRGLLVYWPMTRRWFLPDRMAEEKWPSPPTHCGEFCDAPECLQP